MRVSLELRFVCCVPVSLELRSVCVQYRQDRVVAVFASIPPSVPLPLACLLMNIIKQLACFFCCAEGI